MPSFPSLLVVLAGALLMSSLTAGDIVTISGPTPGQKMKLIPTGPDAYLLGDTDGDQTHWDTYEPGFKGMPTKTIDDHAWSVVIDEKWGVMPKTYSVDFFTGSSAKVFDRNAFILEFYKIDEKEGKDYKQPLRVAYFLGRQKTCTTELPYALEDYALVRVRIVKL